MRSIAISRFVAVLSGLAIVAGLVSAESGPALGAAKPSAPTTFRPALPAHPTSQRMAQAGISSNVAVRWHAVKTSNGRGHSLSKPIHRSLRRTNRLIRVPMSQQRNVPSPTITPSARASLRRVAQGKYLPTNVQTLYVKAVTRWMARRHTARKNDMTIGTNFNASGYTGWIPPDGGMAAGPHEVVVAINGAFNTFAKSGAVLSSQTLASFFSGLPDSGSAFDPHVLFDPNSQRFWMTAAATDGSTSSELYVAVSNDSDTQDGWSIWWMPIQDVFPGSWCDYPEIGVSSGGYVYLTCNIFGLSGPGDRSRHRVARKAASAPNEFIRVMPESEFEGAGCCSWWEWWNLDGRSIQPTVMVNSATSNGEFLTSSGFGGSGNTLSEFQIYNEGNCCGSAPSFYEGYVNIYNFDPAPCAGQPSNAYQCLDQTDTRTLGAYWQYPYLYTWMDVACNSGYSCPRVVMVNNGSGKLTQSYNLSYGSYTALAPAIGVRPDGSMSLVSDEVSSANALYASSWVIGLPDPSVCTACTDGGAYWVGAGQGNYQRLYQGRNRWGDYSGAWPDPDGTGIWVLGEYATNSNTWGMWEELTREAGDTTAPSSSAYLSPAPNAYGWNNSNVTVNVSASDSESGVYYQTIQGTGAEPFGPYNYGSSASPLIQTEGATTVYYNATDNWRNTNSTQSIGVKLDKTYPTTTSVKYTVLSPTSVKISGAASDPGCGSTGSCVKTLYYYYNDATNGSNSGVWRSLGSSSGASGSFTLKTVGILAGNHLVAVDPIDYAGNFRGCSAAGGNTCPNTFTVHALTITNSGNRTGAFGSVKFTAALTPNPCGAKTCLYRGLTHGSSVKFTETPKRGRSFQYWLVNGHKRSAKTIGVAINQNTVVKAIYK